MAQNHVTQLVSHDTCHFGVRVRGFDHPAVEEHRAAGQREGVDLSEIDDIEGVAERRLPQVARNGVDQPVADSLHELVSGLVADEWQLLPHFRRCLLTELHVLFGRVAVLIGFDPSLRARGQREDRNEHPSQGSRASGSPCVLDDECSSHGGVECKVHSNAITR